MQFKSPCKVDPSSHFGCFVGWEDMLGGGGVGACYVHMAANASFTNSHQMMDSDKMGMNDHIEVSKISLMSFIHILELMKFAKSGRNAQRHFCLFIFPTKDCHR